MFCDSNPWLFAIIDLNQHAFSVLKGVTPTFSNLGILLKIDIKNCPLLGKLLSVWKTVSVLPKSALSAQSAKIGENSHSFFNVSYTWYKSLATCNLAGLILTMFFLCKFKLLQTIFNQSHLIKEFLQTSEQRNFGISLLSASLKKFWREKLKNTVCISAEKWSRL